MQLTVLRLEAIAVVANPVIAMSAAVVEVFLGPSTLVVELGEWGASNTIAPCLSRHVVDNCVCRTKT